MCRPAGRAPGRSTYGLWVAGIDYQGGDHAAVCMAIFMSHDERRA
jgi:hypothetical protein